MEGGGGGNGMGEQGDQRRVLFFFFFYLLDKNQSDFRRFKLKSCKYSLVEQTSIKKPLHILIYLIQHRGHKQILIKRFIIPSFIGSFCLNNIFEYFHSN